MKPHEMILLVEDEPAIRRLMTFALLGAGYRVREARNGREALAVRDPDAIDLLVIDMRLPYAGGQEVIDELRKRVPGLKALSISGNPLNASPDPDVAFLAKPFSRAALLSQVRAVLDRDRPNVTVGASSTVSRRHTIPYSQPRRLDAVHY